MGHMFIVSRKGGVHLVHNNFVYRSNLRRQGRELNKIYWECIYNRSTKCRGRLKSIGDDLIVTNGIYFIFLSFVHWFCFWGEKVLTTLIDFVSFASFFSFRFISTHGFKWIQWSTIMKKISVELKPLNKLDA